MNERFCNILYAAVFKQARNNQIQCVLRKNSVSDIVTRAVIIGVSRIIPVKHALFDVIPSAVIFCKTGVIPIKYTALAIIPGAVIVCEPRIVPIQDAVFDVIPCTVVLCKTRIIPFKLTVFDIIPIKPTDLLLCLLLNISADGYGFISDIITH